jgi:hypothetical protein
MADAEKELFHGRGTFTAESIGVTYRGPKELGRTVEIHAPERHVVRRFANGEKPCNLDVRQSM